MLRGINVLNSPEGAAQIKLQKSPKVKKPSGFRVFRMHAAIKLGMRDYYFANIVSVGQSPQKGSDARRKRSDRGGVF